MVGKIRSAYRSNFALLLVGMLLAVSWTSVFPHGAVAADLTERSLHITNADPGVATRHTFTFSYATTGATVGSVVFDYCTSPLPMLTCDTPSGLDASGVALVGQAGETGFTIFDAQQGRIVLSRSPASLPVQNPSSYIFSNVINPTGAPDTFYARITTFASSDGTGVPIDFGAVVNSTTQGVGVSTEVPPILNFCVGVSIPGDCSTAEGNLIDLGDLSSKLTSTGTSQMMVGTNADFGVSIAVHGTTMTSGNNTITALSSSTPSAPGNSQFGLNLRANTSPVVGQDPSGIGAVSPVGDYAIPNRFAFASGDTVAAHPDVTDIRKFTASYIVNVSPNQTPGVYTATLTYICTASF